MLSYFAARSQPCQEVQAVHADDLCNFLRLLPSNDHAEIRMLHSSCMPGALPFNTLTRGNDQAHSHLPQGAMPHSDLAQCGPVKQQISTSSQMWLQGMEITAVCWICMDFMLLKPRLSSSVSLCPSKLKLAIRLARSTYLWVQGTTRR